ncbi:MAG: DUF6476 family protein [Rhodobacteraceae bacterium]|nr:DUF6476 family protein [Paracoccaceae bacterium]
MSDPSTPELPEPPQLRFLRLLVTTLTVVMIGGLLVVIGLLVTRLNADDIPLPAEINLPDSTTPEAVTIGATWIAVVSGDQILILDRESGRLRQTIELERPTP